MSLSLGPRVYGPASKKNQQKMWVKLRIQYQYNNALKRAGLFPKFSSTHIMRHSMGTITRMVTGSMDSAQAVTGHKDIKMAQHYSSMTR